MKDDFKPLLKSVEVTSLSIVLVLCLKRELYVYTTHGRFVYENAMPRLEEQRLHGGAENSTVAGF